MRVVITGAGGFLGRSLTNRLIADPQITVLALTSHPEKMPVCGNLIVCGIDDFFSGRQSFRPEDILIHCAFPRTASGPEFASGLRYVTAVLEKAEEAMIQGVINISSQSVYNAKRAEPARETDAVCPEGGYAIGKFAQELMASGICRHVPVTNVRLASLIGPGFDQRLTNKMVNYALTSGKLSVKRNSQRFGFLDVEDAVSGIWALLKKSPEKWHPVYNLGASREYSLLELANIVKTVVQSESGQEVEITVTEGDEISNSGLDSTLLNHAADYVPSVSMEQSIRMIYRQKCCCK